MIVERGIVPQPLGVKIFDAINRVDAAADQPGAVRSGDYLKVERDLMAVGGPDISRLHSGRSRQDIGATIQRLITRDDFLAAFEKLNGMRDAILALAAQAPNAVIPAYTWGVQAQPITLGHYLSGYAAAFEREATRMRETYARLNLSPLGAAALGTSSFPVDRPRLAELLGFDAPVGNSYDANQISPIDGGAEIAGLATSGALVLGALIADVTTQYAQTEPWMLLTEGEQTGVSSIMPQKRNPTGLARLRAEASNLIGESATFSFIAHNVQPGMSDYKDSGNPREYPDVLLRDMAALFAHAADVIRTMTFKPDRALDEVNSDYSTTTELADTLQREADVPFRIGHHFASELVNYGRAHHLRASQIPFTEAQRIYADVAAASKVGAKLPLSEEQFRRSLTAENMVTAARDLADHSLPKWRGCWPLQRIGSAATGSGSMRREPAWRPPRNSSIRRLRVCAVQNEVNPTAAARSEHSVQVGPLLPFRALPDHARKTLQRHQRLAGIGPFLQFLDRDVIERLPAGAAGKQRARDVHHARRTRAFVS